MNINSQNNKENINMNIEQNNTNMKLGEMKMDVEPQTSNELIASNSTKYSNNTKTSVESSNQISFFILQYKIKQILQIMNKII